MGTRRLDLVLDMEHPLVTLASVLSWKRLAAEFQPLYGADDGWPGLLIRPMAGLHFLKRMEGRSDGEMVRRRVENPYWPFFGGEESFQHRLPIDPSQMTRWRDRLGKERMETCPKATIQAGLTAKTLSR